jgi:hypothetical protein
LLNKKLPGFLTHQLAGAARWPQKQAARLFAKVPESFTSGAQTYAAVAGNLPRFPSFRPAAPAAGRPSYRIPLPFKAYLIIPFNNG